MIDVEKRATVLRFSLNLEMLASKILSYLLNVDEYKTSYSFGNKSSSLSFNQKLNLLIDNKSITKDEKKKLVAFASIRNQFMHNIDANTFEEAFDHIDGLEKQMRKIYPENFTEDDDLETCLHYCVRDLHKDGVLILTSFKGGLDEKMTTEVEAKFYRERFKGLQETVFDSFNRVIKALEEQNVETLSRENLTIVLKLLKQRTITKDLIDQDFIEEILDLLTD